MFQGYHTNLCDCRNDCNICMTFLCCGWTGIPMACNWAESRSEKCSFWHWAAPSNGIWTRANIRALNGEIETHYGKDCCTYLFCCPCAVCQDSRELKFRAAAIDSSDTQRTRDEYVPPIEGTAPPPPSGGSNSEMVQPLSPIMMVYDPATYQYPVVDSLQYPPQPFAYPPA